MTNKIYIVFEDNGEAYEDYDKCSDCEYINYDNFVKKVETQQKEFIKFLEDNYNLEHDIWYIKILQKYKELIDDDRI